MVTVRTPVKRVVSMRATMAVDSPGRRKGLRTWALVQPHETRTLEMLTGPAVLLVTRKEWARVGPRGTEPKSLDSSSNSASAHVPAAAGPTAQRPARTTRLYRNMLTIFLVLGLPGPPGATCLR